MVRLEQGWHARRGLMMLPVSGPVPVVRCHRAWVMTVIGKPTALAVVVAGGGGCERRALGQKQLADLPVTVNQRQGGRGAGDGVPSVPVADGAGIAAFRGAPFGRQDEGSSDRAAGAWPTEQVPHDAGCRLRARSLHDVAVNDEQSFQSLPFRGRVGTSAWPAATPPSSWPPQSCTTSHELYLRGQSSC